MEPATACLKNLSRHSNTGRRKRKGRYWNRVPSKYKHGLLPLHEPAAWMNKKMYLSTLISCNRREADSRNGKHFIASECGPSPSHALTTNRSQIAALDSPKLSTVTICASLGSILMSFSGFSKLLHLLLKFCTHFPSLPPRHVSVPSQPPWFTTLSHLSPVMYYCTQATQLLLASEQFIFVHLYFTVCNCTALC